MDGEWWMMVVRHLMPLFRLSELKCIKPWSRVSMNHVLQCEIMASCKYIKMVCCQTHMILVLWNMLISPPLPSLFEFVTLSTKVVDSQSVWSYILTILYFNIFIGAIRSGLSLSCILVTKLLVCTCDPRNNDVCCRGVYLKTAFLILRALASSASLLALLSRVEWNQSKIP